MTMNADPNIDAGDALPVEDAPVEETVSRAEYEAIQSQLAQASKMAKFGNNVFERLTVLRESDQNAYDIVRNAMETGALPSQPSASGRENDPYGTIDDEMITAIHQVVKQVMQNEVAPLKSNLTRMQMDNQIASLKSKYGEDAVAANHDDLVSAIDANPGILKQPNGLETLFKSVDHDKVYDRNTARKLEEENKAQERFLRQRGLPAGNLGGRSPAPKLESFEDMWEYAKQQLRGSSLED